MSTPIDTQCAVAVRAAPMPEEPDWFEDYPNMDRCTAHLLAYLGHDLTASGVFHHEIAPCLLCTPREEDQDPVVILTEETLTWGRVIHFVCCGSCGTRGPWAKTESAALALWNDAHKRHNPACT
jgi:hypothetical protein